MKILQSIYESLLNILVESRLTRTIDKKVWLSVASTCSRNRSTEAENIKPLTRLTKEDLLPRYVAALLIMKKPCPNSIEDIEDNKTFKFIGKKLIDLGCSFDDIKNEYIANGGKLVTTTIPESPKEEIKELEAEIKLGEQKQETSVDTTELGKPVIVRKLPDGVKSYDDIMSFIKHTFTDLKSICEEIYKLLDITYYSIHKTFYKLDLGQNKIYFKDVTTDDDKKVYFNDRHYIYITWVNVNKRKVEESTFGILVNNMTVNDLPLTGNKVILDKNLVLTQELLTDLCITILSKLTYVNQLEFNHPIIKGQKQVSSAWGSFGKEKRDFNQPIDNKEYKKIIKSVMNKFNTFDSCSEILHTLLYKQKLGNISDGEGFEYSEPLYTDNLLQVELNKKVKHGYASTYIEVHVSKLINKANLGYKPRLFKIKGIISTLYDSNLTFTFDYNGKMALQAISLWSLSYNKNKSVSSLDIFSPVNYSYKEYPYYISEDLVLPGLWALIAAILYYANNYSNLLNIKY